MTYDRAKLYFEMTFSLTSPSEILTSLLSPSATARVGGATTGGSTASAIAPSEGTTGTWSGMENEENLRRWRSDDRAREKNAKLTTGER